MKLCIYLLLNPNRKLTLQQSTCLRLYFLRYFYLYYGLNFLQNFPTKNNTNKTVHPLLLLFILQQSIFYRGQKSPSQKRKYRFPVALNEKNVSAVESVNFTVKRSKFFATFFYEARYRKLQRCTLVLSETLESCKGTVDVLSMVKIIKLTVYASRKKRWERKRDTKKIFNKVKVMDGMFYNQLTSNSDSKLGIF